MLPVSQQYQLAPILMFSHFRHDGIINFQSK
jgi:hypothetical protein